MICDQDILDLCRYRLKQADDAVLEARLLQNAGHLRGAINRAYYAMFYALQVLIVKNRVKVSKHSGVISYFDREFIKSGKIHRDFSKWLHRIFDLRQDADYGDMFEPTEVQTEQAVIHASKFVLEIQDYFQNQYVFDSNES